MAYITIELPETAKTIENKKAFNKLKKAYQADNCDLIAEPKSYPCYMLKVARTDDGTGGWNVAYVVYLYPIKATGKTTLLPGMNLYEYGLLLAHVGATQEQIIYALRVASEWLVLGKINHQQRASDWFELLDFNQVPGEDFSVHGICLLLWCLPSGYNEKGLPSGLERETAKANFVKILDTR